MLIDFDVKKETYKGEQTITYTNNSPDSLDVVYFHLYWNAFQRNSAMDYYVRNIKDAGDIVKTIFFCFADCVCCFCCVQSSLSLSME